MSSEEKKEGSSSCGEKPAYKKGGKPFKKKSKWGLVRGPIAGTKGILVTCAVGLEQRCANEISAFLEEVSQDLYPSDAPADPVSVGPPPEKSAHMSLEAALEEEKKSMEKDHRSEDSSSSSSRLVPMFSGVNGVVYIRVTKEEMSPTALAHAASVKISSSKGSLRVRTAIKLLPLEKTFQVSAADITLACRPILKDAFVTGAEANPIYGLLPRPASYHIEWRSRNCSAVHREAAIEAVVAAMPKAEDYAAVKGSAAPVIKYKGSDCSVIVEAFRNVCGVSVAPEYDKYLQYNLRKLGDQAALSALS